MNEKSLNIDVMKMAQLWKCNLANRRCYMLVSDIARTWGCNQAEIETYFSDPTLRGIYTSYSNKDGVFPIGGSAIPYQEMCITLEGIKYFLTSHNLWDENTEQIVSESYRMARYNYYLD